jgi:hypothetical protein
VTTVIDHQARAHARLSGSVASIFTKCTAAPALWEGRIRKATAFTREGTAAHELADAILAGGVTPQYTITVEGEVIEITDEMRVAVALYVGYIENLRTKSIWHAIEQRFTMDLLWHPDAAPEPMFGSADYVGVSGTILDVADLKFGKGVPVAADNNAQLLFYALGVWLWLLENRPDLASRIKLVRLHIIQPRISEDASVWTIPLIDLLMWAEEVLKKSVDDITTGNTKFKAGAHCGFCLGKGICPELATEAMKAAKSVFPPAPPSTMSDEDLGEALSRAELVSMWLSGVRAEVETRIKNGKSVPGWKLVTKKGYRQFTDEDDTLSFLSDLVDGQPTMFMTEPKLLSPAQVEKKLKAMGEDPHVIDAFVSAPETGTTLVPEDDKRPAVVTGPQNVFSTVE